MKGKIILVLLAILLLSNVEAISISISPPIVNLVSEVNKKVCVNFSISSDKTVYFSIENLWSMKKENNEFKDYNLSSQEVLIESDYPKEIGVYSKEEVGFCVKAKNAGTYRGIVLFKSSEGTGAIGTLVRLRVLGETENFSEGAWIIVLMGVNSLLLMALLFLLMFKRGLGKEE